MSNIVISPESGILEFNYNSPSGAAIGSATAPIRLDATGGNSFITGGNLGVGMTAPTAALHVNGDGGTAMKVENGSLKIRYPANNDAITITPSVGNEGRILASDGDTSSPHPLKIGGDYVRITTSGVSAATEVARFTADGKVGIGVSDPDSTLEIKGEGNTSDTTAFRVRDSDNQELLYARNDGIVVVPHNYLYVSAAAGAYVQNALRVRGSLFNDQGSLNVGSANATSFTGPVFFGNSDAVNFSGSVAFTNMPTISGNSFITGFAEGDTLQTVTDRGATTTNNIEIQGAGSKSLTVDSTDGHASVVIDRHSASYDANLSFQTNGATKWRLWNDSNDTTFSIRDEVNASNVMTWEAGGNVGIGIDDPTDTLTINQTADSNGIRINGYDDHSSSFAKLFVKSNGHTELSQSTNGADGYLKLSAENYLQLSAGTFVYTDDQFRIYDDGQLSLGNGADFFFKYDNSTDKLKIHSSTNDGITMDTAGKVGIGTNAPAVNLHVESSTSAQFKVGNGTQFVRLYADADEATILADGSVDMRFYVGGGEKMRLDTAGRLGIGSTSPQGRLDAGADTDQNIFLGRARFGSYVSDYLYLSHYDNGSSTSYALKQSPAGSTAINAKAGQNVSMSVNNTDVLFVKGSTSRVGINTTDPSGVLDVGGDGADIFLHSNDYKIARIQPRGTSADLDKGLFSLFSTTTEAVRIDSAGSSWFNGGSVGIGTDNPQSYLDVKTQIRVRDSNSDSTHVLLDSNASEGRLRLNNGSNWGLIARGQANNPYLGAYEGGSLNIVGFSTSDGANIDHTLAKFDFGNQRVGIGTTNPSQTLHVEGTARVSGHTDLASSVDISNTTRIYTKLGVGDSSWITPSHALEVNGDATFAQYLYHRGDEDTNIKFVDDDFMINVGGATFFRATETTQNTIKLNSDNEDTDFYLYGNHSTPALFMRGSDREIGINTTNPTASLHVVGNASINGASSDGVLTINNAAGSQSLRIDQNSIRTTTNNNLTLFSNGTTSQLVLENGGNVGIGTNDPVYKLTIAGNAIGSTGGLRINDPSNAAYGAHFSFADTPNEVHIGGITNNVYNDAIGIYRESTRTITINSSQQVGIGTTSPSNKLEVHGDVAITSKLIHRADTDTFLEFTNNTITLDAGGEEHIKLEVGGVTINEGGQPNDFRIEGDTDTFLFFVDGSADKVGIGITDPDQKLDVDGNIRIPNQGKIVFGSAGTSPSDYLELYDVGTGDTLLRLVQDGVKRFSVQGVNGHVYMQNKLQIDIGSNNNHTGEISFNTQYDTAFIRSSYTDPAATTETFLAFCANTAGASNGTVAEQMRIAGDNVGIGTTNPAHKLEVVGDVAISDAKKFKGLTYSSSYVNFQNDTTLSANRHITFDINGSTEAVRIEDGGDVGIGTANPVAKLHVEGSMQVKGDASWAGTDSQAGAIFMDTAGRGLLGAFSTNYARPLITANSNYIDLGSAGTSLINGFRFYAGSASSSVGTYDFYTSGSNNRLHIAKDGSVGIGSASPVQKLDVAGVIRSSVTSRIQADVYNNSANSANIIYRSSSKTIVGNNASALVIEDGGDVGVGTTNPVTKLEVQDSAGAPMLQLRPNAASTDLNPIILYRSQLDGSANYMLCEGTSTYFGTYHGGVPSDKSEMIRILPNSSDSPSLRIGDAGSTAANLQVGGNIKLLNNGASYINGGDVGIGTATPAQKLHLEFSNTDTSFAGGVGGSWGSEGLLIENTSSTADTMAIIQLRNNDADIHIAGIRQGTNDSDLGFFFEGSEKVRFTKDGNVGIGINNPTRKLFVQGDAEINTNLVVNTAVYTKDWYGIGANDQRILNSAGTAQVTIENGGNVGIGTTDPSVKLDVDGTIKTKVYAIGNLPSASPAGQRAMVNNSYYTFGSSSLGSTVYAGGSAVAPVYSDGSYWRYG